MLVLGTVFLNYCFLSLREYLAQFAKQGEIIVAAILEDTSLYVAVTLVGIVVEIAQVLLCHLINMDVVFGALPVFYKCVTDVRCQGETDIAVCLRLLGKHHHRHLLQTSYKTIVAGDVLFVVGKEGFERQLCTLKTLILFCGLVTSIGEVEDIILFLRIEHQ